MARLLSRAELFTKLSENEQRDFLLSMSDAQAAALNYDWQWWGRPTQLDPLYLPGTTTPYDNWLILAGRGFGKTRTGAEWVRAGMCGSTPLTGGRWRHIALIAETAADARDVLVGDGKATCDPTAGSGILQVHPKDFLPNYEPSKRRLTWPNGAAATLYNAVEPDQLRGPQHDAAWLDELCFVAGTTIATSSGQIPIENIINGDLVWTRSGLRRVVNCGETKRSSTWRLETFSGNAIEGTENHPIFIDGEFVPLSKAKVGGVACLISSYGVAKSGIGTKTTTKIVAESYCTEKNTKTHTANCLRTLTCTIKTKIRKITICRIWCLCREAITLWNTTLAGLRLGKRTDVAPTRRNMCGANEKLKSCSVLSAATNSVRQECAPSSAQITANQQTSVSITPTIIASVSKTGRICPLFNLEVEGENEYFANGLLVHNCKWRYASETFDQLEFGMRTGSNPQKLISTTPKPTMLLKAVMKDPGTVITRGSTYDNVANLAGKFLDRIRRKFEGTRLGRQELDAEVLEDLDGALWKRSNIDQYRIQEKDLPPLVRIVIAIDPAVSSEENSNETGIIAVGLGENGHGYVLDDASGVYSPIEWANEAISLYRARKADRIIAEVNQGGDMVEETLRAVERNIPYSSVWASRGKWIRAEPISSLYEKGMVHHVGCFSQLEDQQCTFTVDFDRKGHGYSPDRLDAAVWGLTEIMVEGDGRKFSFG